MWQESPAVGASAAWATNAASPQLSGGAYRVAVALAGGSRFPESAAEPGRSADAGLVSKLGELTPQQMKVLSLICEGKLNKQIAYELDVAETTVKAHITSIFKKLGIHSRTQAVLAMQRCQAEGLVSDASFGAGHAA